MRWLDEIATLASHIYAGTCRWLELVGELDRRGGFSGCTVAEWLAWRCALTPRAALGIDPATCDSGAGDRMDLGLAVEALLSQFRRSRAA